jgi:hypothetical protein
MVRKRRRPSRRLVTGTATVSKRPTTRTAPSASSAQLIQFLAGYGALVGGLLYATLRIALGHFYDSLGVTPEEVGWDITTVLARFALPLVVAVGIILFLLLRFTEARFVRLGFIGWVRTLWWVFPLAFIALIVTLVGFAQWDVNRLRSGKPLSANLDQFVPISAPCVHVLWIDPPQQRQEGMPSFDSAHEFFLLGQQEGTTVLFDATVDQSLRIPSGSVLLTSCRP